MRRLHLNVIQTLVINKQFKSMKRTERFGRLKTFQRRHVIALL